MFDSRLVKVLVIALLVSMMFVAVAFALPGDTATLYGLTTDAATGQLIFSPVEVPLPTVTVTASAPPVPTPTVTVTVPGPTATVTVSPSGSPTSPVTASPSVTATPTPTPTGTPVSDPLAAIRAATAGQTVFVPAGTYTGTLTVPDGVSVVGAGRDVSWIKGQVHFGNNSRIVGLKIGDTGMAAVHNKHTGAVNTVFEDCRFRGGGGNAWTYVVLLGESGATSGITFRRCDVECNLGVENDSMSRGYNDVTIWVGGSVSVSDVLFEECHIGVSNGVRSGAPRMAVECYTDDGATYGWQRVTFRGCVVEASDGHGLDFSDESNKRSEGLLVEDCWVKGAGLKTTAPWAASIDLEYPLRAVIRNNRFGLGREFSVQMTTRGDPYSPSYTLWEGNVIDLTPNGVTKASYWRAYTVTSDSPWGPTNTITGG